MNITFDGTSVEFILEALGFSIDKDGYVLDFNYELVESTCGDFININELGALKKSKKTGQYLFYKKSLASLMSIEED